MSKTALCGNCVSRKGLKLSCKKGKLEMVTIGLEMAFSFV